MFRIAVLKYAGLFQPVLEGVTHGSAVERAELKLGKSFHRAEVFVGVYGRGMTAACIEGEPAPGELNDEWVHDAGCFGNEALGGWYLRKSPANEDIC